MSQLAFVIQEKGAQPTVASASIPQINEGEVLIKLLAAAVNPHENATVDIGLFANNYPYILGSDGAGVVEEVGPGVTNVKKGDEVIVHGDIFDSETGTFQQYAKADAAFISKFPSNVSVEEASTLPVAIAAVFVGYYHKSGFQLIPPWTKEGLGKYKGHSIFIAGGASSVGQFAIQLAKASGFTTIATTASESNHGLVTELGATHVFPRDASAAEIKAAIGPTKLGLDAISNDETQLLSVGVLDQDKASQLILVTRLRRATKDAAGLIQLKNVLGSSAQTREISAPFWAAIEGWLKDGTLKPTKVEILPGGLYAITGALERLKKGAVSGKKLVVRPPETEGANNREKQISSSL